MTVDSVQVISIFMFNVSRIDREVKDKDAKLEENQTINFSKRHTKKWEYRENESQG